MGNTFKLGNYVNGIFQDSSNNIGIGAAPSGTYKFEVTGTAKVSGILTLGSTISNGTYTYTLPSATGTLALTSALGDYLPLAGGTLTGALGGTSASFSSTATATAFIPSGATIPSNGMYLSAANTLNFATNTTNRLTITSLGSVCIGSTNSFYANATRGSLALAGSLDSIISFQNQANTESYTYLYSDDTASHNFYIQNTTANGNLYLATNATVRMTVLNTGLVGIGTSSPVNASLHIANPISSETIRNQDNSAYNTFYNSAGTVRTGYIQFNASAASTIATDIAQALTINTSGTERMRITSGGLVGIANSGINACRLAVTYGGGGSIAVGIAIQDGDNAIGAQYMQFLNAATTAIGSISRNGGFNQINYNTTSDYRLKEDFKDFNGIEKVTSIKVYDHKWIGFEGRSNGVIAHELAEVLPYAVIGEKDAVDENENIKPQQVDYSKLVPVLIKAIQEMNTKLDEQNQTIQSLQEQNQDLKSRLDKANL